MNYESAPVENKMIFSSGVESATLATSSNLLRPPLQAILELYAENTSNQKLYFKVKKELDLTVIAFVTTPICTKHHLQQPQQADLVSSSVLKHNNFPHFEFLCNKEILSFSVNKVAISLFHEYHEQLHQLKSQIDSSMRLIVTGHALGGSIASLFTLWLLDSKSSNKKPPLCITFGSPLLADNNLQKCISLNSTWNSCFLHVASLQDPLPAFFISTNYKPFGTFLLCSDEGSACFNDPESILRLLATVESTMINLPSQEFDIHLYAKTVENLHRKAVCKALTTSLIPQNIVHYNSLEAGIIFQLLALGLSQILQQPDTLKMMKQREVIVQTKKSFDPSKKLNNMKIYMAYLEWYKKKAKSDNTGMYDKYKKQSGASDQDIKGWKKDLTLYWKEMMKEAEIKPMKEGAAFRTRWLYAGTNYRRMVEPLDIADYYNNGGTNYEARGRSRHYQQLEEWLEDEKSPLATSNKQNVESILTLDSCFWARVEEALIACEVMERSGKFEDLREFEEYVYGLLQSYAVSSEIFLKYTSFMTWWNQYYKLHVTNGNNDSKLVRFMCDTHNYKLYAEGAFDFSRL